MRRCADARIDKRANARTHMTCACMHKYNHIRMHDARICATAFALCWSMRSLRATNLRTRKYANMTIRKHANTQTCKHANTHTRICAYASARKHACYTRRLKHAHTLADAWCAYARTYEGTARMQIPCAGTHDAPTRRCADARIDKRANARTHDMRVHA